MAWVLAYANDENGKPTGGDLAKLAAQVQSGAPVRLRLIVPNEANPVFVDGQQISQADLKLFESGDLVSVKDGHVFALVLQYIINVTPVVPPEFISWNTFFNPSPSIFSTLPCPDADTGNERHRLPPPFSFKEQQEANLPYPIPIPKGLYMFQQDNSHLYRNHIEIHWYVEVGDYSHNPIWEKLYECDDSGLARVGSIDQLRQAVLNGRPIRVAAKNYYAENDTAIFPTARVVASEKLGHVFATVPFFIQNFSYGGDYDYESYYQGLPASGVSVFGTDGYERPLLVTDSTNMLTSPPEKDNNWRRWSLAWYARKSNDVIPSKLWMNRWRLIVQGIINPVGPDPPPETVLNRLLSI